MKIEREVRRLGSAKEGVRHWWAQRVTAAALVPLSIWLVWSLAGFPRTDYPAVVGWISRPLNSVLLILLLGTAFRHAQLGLQVVIEDYVHGEGTKIISLVLIKFAAVTLAAATIFSVLKISFLG